MKRLLGSLMIAMCASSISAQDTAPVAVEPIVNSAPDYGDVLFHYYQQDYQQALKSLSMVKINRHNTNQFGTHRYLESLLQVINGNELFVSNLDLDDTVNVQAILSLAQEQSALENWTQTERLLAIIEDDIPAVLRDQYRYLYARVQLALNAKTPETNLIKGSELDAAWLQSLSGDKERGAQLTSLLSKVQSIGETQQVFKDQALHNLGYQFLAQDDADNAIASFSNISINSTVANSATLGLGLAFNRTSQYDNANAAFTRVLESGEPSVLYYEAVLGNAYAQELAGNEVSAINLLIDGIAKAQQRTAAQTDLATNLKQQSACFVTLLADPQASLCNYFGEQNNENFVALLASQSLINANRQYTQLTQMEMDYNQQLQTISAFNFLLNHQIKMISELLNASVTEGFEARIADTTAQRAAIVTSVDKAEGERNGQFFLSQQYLDLQERIDNTFARMVFLKRAGQKNTASERRVTLMQRIVWWHSFSNFSEHLAQTR
ncbi:MAG: tetratricopeptide repeat protein, partial [Psychrobium sp.]